MALPVGTWYGSGVWSSAQEEKKGEITTVTIGRLLQLYYYSWYQVLGVDEEY